MEKAKIRPLATPKPLNRSSPYIFLYLNPYISEKPGTDFVWTQFFLRLIRYSVLVTQLPIVVG